MIARRIYDKLKATHPRWGPISYKLFLASMLASAVAIPLVLAGLPFVEFLNDMAAQPKGKTQMTYGRTFGQKPEPLVVRSPVPGTISRDFVRYQFDYLGNDIADAQYAGRHLANPVPLTLANVKRGQAQYNIYCIACHGERAEGNGPATGANVIQAPASGRPMVWFPAPPSLHTEQARGYADGTIFHIVTKGTGKMPSYADKLDPDDRWKVIYYVRALQRSMNPKAGDDEEAPRAGGIGRP